MNPGPFLCLALWNQNELRQGATLPVTREWPTKSPVSGTENVPALLSMGAGVRSLEATIYIYLFIYIYIYVREPFLRLALWNQREPGSFLCLAHWKQSHSCVWLLGTKMNPGPFLCLALWNQNELGSFVCLAHWKQKTEPFLCLALWK